jgi:Holliday junction resolvase
MTEQQIQSKLIKELEAQGYYVIKLIKTNKNGIPDILAIPRDSDARFYEVKTKVLERCLSYRSIDIKK